MKLIRIPYSIEFPHEEDVFILMNFDNSHCSNILRKIEAALNSNAYRISDVTEDLEVINTESK